MGLQVNSTILLSTAITAAVNGATTFLIIRYIGKAADSVEKHGLINKIKEVISLDELKDKQSLEQRVKKLEDKLKED